MKVNGKDRTVREINNTTAAELVSRIKNEPDFDKAVEIATQYLKQAYIDGTDASWEILGRSTKPT